MIKPAMKIDGAPGKESKGCAHAIASLAWINPSTLSSDAHSRKTESGSGDTGYIAVRFIHCGRIGSRAIQHQPGISIGLLPEVTKRAARDFFKKCLVGSS